MTARTAIRALAPRDLDAVIVANDAVGWRGRRAMLEFYVGRDDSALLVGELDGKIVGCGGATRFPGVPRTERSIPRTERSTTPTGWVHNIVVRPDRQRAGLGAALTEAAIAWLHAHGVDTVLLLATDAGRPVYERLGFVAGERYGACPWPKPDDRAESGFHTRRLMVSDLPVVCALDRAATGEDRARFINTFATSGWVITRGDQSAADGAEIVGFHLACPWGGGPTIARDPDAGRALIRLAAGLQSPNPPRPLGVPETNAIAMRDLADRGLTPERYVTRMWLGTPPPWQAEMVFGVFNFAVG